MDWKVGDWAIHDYEIVQIKRIEDDIMEVSTGMFATSGYRLGERLRPLTLRNKRIAEYSDYYYKELKELKGEGGFNYPDIHRYFSQVTRDAIDSDDENVRAIQGKLPAFVEAASKYQPIIDGVSLFR